MGNSCKAHQFPWIFQIQMIAVINPNIKVDVKVKRFRHEA